MNRCDWGHYEELGRQAWLTGDTRPPPKDGSWQAKAWKEGFDKAYEKERPALDLDHEEQVAERRKLIRIVRTE